MQQPSEMNSGYHKSEIWSMIYREEKIKDFRRSILSDSKN